MPELESLVLAPESPLLQPETRYACVEFNDSSNGEFSELLHASLASEEVNQVEEGLNTEEYVPLLELEGGQQVEMPPALLPSYVAPSSFEEELKGMATRDLLHSDQQLTPFLEQVTGQSIEKSEEYVPSLLQLDSASILGLQGPSTQVVQHLFKPGNEESSEWLPSLFQQPNRSLGMGTASSNVLQGLRPSTEALGDYQGVMRNAPTAPMLHFQSASAIPTSRRNADLRSGLLSYGSAIPALPLGGVEHLYVQRQNLAEHLGVQTLKDMAMQSHLIRLHREMPQFRTHAGNAFAQFGRIEGASLCSRGSQQNKSNPLENYLYENLLLRAQMQVLRGTGPTSRATCLERKRKQEQLRKRLAKSQAEELLQLHNTKNKAALQADKSSRKQLQQFAPCSFMDDSSSDSDWEVDVDDQNDWGRTLDPWEDVEQNTWNQLELQESKKKPLTAEAKEILASQDIQHKLSISFHKFLNRVDGSSGESDPESSECEGSDADSDSADRATQRETRETIISTRERETCDFFIHEFQQKPELGKLYEDQRNCGAFVCIVCVASGRRWKKFSDLVSLVQHAKTIMKTKKRAEHRGYGRAVCDFLGWVP